MHFTAQETSGKENAARHLMQRFDAAPHGCFLLCDDDNDLRAPPPPCPGSSPAWACASQPWCQPCPRRALCVVTKCVSFLSAPPFLSSPGFSSAWACASQLQCQPCPRKALWMLTRHVPVLFAALVFDEARCAGLAALVGKAFVVGVTAPSVAAAARADPERYVLAERGGTLGMEELMEKVEDHVGSFILG